MHWKGQRTSSHIDMRNSEGCSDHFSNDKQKGSRSRGEWRWDATGKSGGRVNRNQDILYGKISFQQMGKMRTKKDIFRAKQDQT